MRKLCSNLLEPRAIILGFTIFYFIWALLTWIRDPLWNYHRELFVAIVLLISALALVINRRWSNVLAAVMSGQLPFAFFAEFWMLSEYAELRPFSSRHIKAWLWGLSNVGLKPLLWLGLSIIMMSLAVASILLSHAARRHSSVQP
ncbi:MAG: hypothetical protein JO360_08825 [Acidobacteria bacterium]|nr:hypothetical protein [Acidobacteriota bacterium]